MKIFVAGTRGIPDIPGGIEKHCQDLYPLIAEMGHDVYIATRKQYALKKYREWKKIKLIYLYSPVTKNFEAIFHTFLAVLKAKKLKVDIIHIHAVGPGLMVPLAKALGLKVVLTNHGPDYDRQKWGNFAKTILKTGEYLGGKFADSNIAISSVIQKIVKKRCKKESHIIYNGVMLPDASVQSDYLDEINAAPGKYLLSVGRFVPEKGLALLIKAFKTVNTEHKLIIAGDADHETEYSKQLKHIIDADENIIRTGYLTGENLRQLFSHARLFVLPSYHEGLPIALLEAMSYGLSVLVSDIPANLEVDLPEKCFFECGNAEDLKNKIERLLQNDISENEKSRNKLQIIQKYSWPKIAMQTDLLYRQTMHPAQYKHFHK